MSTAALPQGMKIWSEESDAELAKRESASSSFLPPEAEARYERLRAEFDDAEARLQAHRRRLSEGVSSSLNAGDLLTRQGAAYNIFMRLRDWKAQRGHYRYRSVKLPHVKYSREALEKAQAEVDRIQGELGAIPLAPLTREERRVSALAQIKGLRDQGKPRLSPDGRQMSGIDPSSPAFLAWMLIDEKTWEARVDELVGSQVEGEMSATEKAQKTRELEAELKTAQLREVALVDASEGAAFYRQTLPISVLLAIESAGASA